MGKKGGREWKKAVRGEWGKKGGERWEEEWGRKVGRRVGEEGGRGGDKYRGKESKLKKWGSAERGKGRNAVMESWGKRQQKQEVERNLKVGNNFSLCSPSSYRTVCGLV